MFTFLTSRPRNVRPASRRPQVESLEGRQLLSTLTLAEGKKTVVTAMIQGGHIGTNATAMIQGGHIGTNATAMIQGGHIGTNATAMIQGGHIGTNVFSTAVVLGRKH